MHFIALVASAGLVCVLVWFLFLNEEAEHPLEWKLGGGAAVAIGTFMAAMSAYRLVRNPAYFVIREDGFEYSPGGVSTGLIRWSDIEELREEEVLDGNRGVMSRSRVTAVVLRDADSYMKRFPAALRPLLVSRTQQNGSAILIPHAEFGGKQRAVIALLQEQIEKARAGK